MNSGAKITLSPKQALSFALLIAATVFVLHSQGRSWWCACGAGNLWDSNIWSQHCSQHLVDPYTFTHVLHGLLFCFAAWLFLPKLALGWRLWLATFIECVWEIIENSEFIIHRYREVTISLGYEGDSIINSLGDILSCALGFALAHWLGLRRSALFFVTTELALLFAIRDNLTLNVIMLICPVEAIKAWQMGT